jgi:hypothetical protein
VPLFLLGGLLVVAHQAPLSPWGHQIAGAVVALLMYALVVCWLWWTRGTRVIMAHKREQAQEQVHTARKPQRASASAKSASESEAWDYTWLSSQRNGHHTDT